MGKVRFGAAKGKSKVADDFDAADEEVVRLFQEGAIEPPAPRAKTRSLLDIQGMLKGKSNVKVPIEDMNFD